MKSFVINLKRRPDRLESFLQRCPYPDVEIVYGFDGKNSTLETNKKEKKIFNESFDNKRIKPGARACLISHTRIWKKMIDNGINMAMVLEDDCLFNDNFVEFINDLKIPDDFRIIYLGGRFTKNFTIPREYSIKINEKLVQSNFKNFNNQYHDRTTQAYIISLNTARLLLEVFKNTIDPDEIDHFIIRKLRALEIPVYNTNPLLCYSPAISDSDIR